MTDPKPVKIRCDACPVMCYVAEGMTGACDRYANEGGRIVRCDPLTVLDRRIADGGEIRPFLKTDWDGALVNDSDLFISAIGAGTTYPDYKPAPFIVSRDIDGVDFVTVVTEAIYSYCGVKVKIDTDRHLGHEGAVVRSKGEAVGLVITSEYGSQMLSLGGVDHLTGGTKAEGRVTCDTLMQLCNKEPVELTIDNGANVIVQAGHAPIVDGVAEERMRVGCGSATIGMFASQWQGLVDEVVVVDDHITGVVSEHQAGKVLGWPDTGIKIKGRRSTPGRYFQVAQPGLGWGGTDIDDPLTILGDWNVKKGAKPGLTMLMVSTTGEHAAHYVLNDDLAPVETLLPDSLRASVDLIAENCVHGDVHGRRGWLSAFGRDAKPGSADPIGSGVQNPCHLRRRPGVGLARWRNHSDGGCHKNAGRIVWLRSNSGDCCAAGIHRTTRGLQGAWRPRHISTQSGRYSRNRW